ncbi:hypothetical protein OG946_03400 [Streptomyces sp. NBC_01808]|uniref:hypothetical protein n=1 Tax=Streptomyces sp. NBC_01808 TaxID=2975947 RepID=UPI002DDB3D37|nr:hypothetical protein [Streptomyces sp. NBC_01808]WSA36509.1 hypothetical protein OG946_03400 [Streptomyces sp. NBC_01808]
MKEYVSEAGWPPTIRVVGGGVGSGPPAAVAAPDIDRTATTAVVNPPSRMMVRTRLFIRGFLLWGLRRVYVEGESPEREHEFSGR